MKNRVGYFDIAKGIGIILVVIAHIEYMPLGLREYIVTFHMPAFFVISGMLMRLTGEKERPVRPLILHKLQRIMLPYLVFSIIYPLVDLVKFGITKEGYSIQLFLQDLLAGVTMTGVSVLWFLPALFFSELIVLAAAKNVKKPLVWLLLALLFIALWQVPFLVPGLALTMWRIIYCSILVMLGYMAFPLINRVSGYPVILLPVSAVLFVTLYFTGLANGIVDLHYITFGNKALYYLNAMMGSLALIMLSIFIESKLMSIIGRMLEFFGRHSLFIMITHINFFVLYVSERLAFALSDITPRAKEPVFNIVATVATMLIETVLILLWEKIKKYVILFISDRRKSRT